MKYYTRYTWALLLLSLAAPALAQTNATMIFRDWADDDRAVESQTDAIFLDKGHVKESSDDFALSIYSSSGRWRLSTEYAINPTIAYDLKYLDLDTSSAALPGALTDLSVGAGSVVAHQTPWFLAASAGLGYAGNAPFGDGNAWYAMATAFVGRQLDAKSAITVGLDYNGNRTAYPDVPLPFFSYTRHVDGTLRATVGFPYNLVTYRPSERVSLELELTVPDTLDLTASHKLAQQWWVYGNYNNQLMAFHIAGTDGDRRLFFDQNRLESGVRYRPCKTAAIIAAVGYAFGQEFSRGFDSRDLDRVAKVSDEPYARVGLEIQF